MSNDQAPSTRLYVPAMAGLYDGLSGLAYPFIRVVTGLWAMPHGAQKLFGWFGGSMENTVTFFTDFGIEPALPLAYLVGMTEFFGGLALAIGLWTRPAAAGLFILMCVTIFKVHMVNGFFWTKGGYEYPLMWACLCLAIFIRGGGRLSLDARIGREF